MATDLAVRFWAKVDRRGPDECWPWTGAINRARGGYGTFGRGPREAGTGYAHRVAWELVNGPAPPGQLVCHRCDNPPCCNPAHLFLGSVADNQRDMAAKGRSLRGERHNLAQLSEEDVVAIRGLWARGGLTQQQIAERYKTNKANVSQIVRGKKWRHLLPADWAAPAPRKWSRA